ncbi:MAG: T9SS type A sorting domain-containing protein, partial [Saprospiraceae bacterium]|nr:T9SS type A sorting domain-containing protein [Saprospiraceae bacterium]
AQEKYFDVFIKNPYKKIAAYQLSFDGIVISDLQNFVPDYSPTFKHHNSKVATISVVENMIPKNPEPIEFLRVYYSEALGDAICMSADVIVNEKHEKVGSILIGDCINIVGNNETTVEVDALKARVIPNPVADQSELLIDNSSFSKLSVVIYNAAGEIMVRYDNLSTNSISLKSEDFNSGIYFYQIASASDSFSGKFIIK